MGTWGTGPFDNDEAMDLVGDAEDRGEDLTLDSLMAPIRQVLGPSPGAPWRSYAPAVAAVALLAGLEPKGAEVFAPAVGAAEVEQMLAVIDTVTSPDSDLFQAWEGDAGWLAAMARLRARAQKPKRKRRKPTPSVVLAGPPLARDLSTGDAVGIQTKRGIRYLQARGPREPHGAVWLRLLPPPDGRSVAQLVGERADFSVLVADVPKARRAVGAHFAGNHPVPLGESGRPATASKRPRGEWLIVEPDGTRRTVKERTDSEREYSHSTFVVWEDVVDMCDLDWHPRQDPPRHLIELRQESGRLPPE